VPDVIRPYSRVVLKKGLRYSPVQYLAQTFNRNRLAVLGYHAVDDAVQFMRHIEFLANVAHPVSLDDVLSAAKADVPLPDRAVLLTFDDGDRTVLDVAGPVLHRFGIRGVAFVVTDVLGTNNPFWWVEVSELLSRGGRCPGIAAREPAHVLAYLKAIGNHDRLRAIEQLRDSAGASHRSQEQLRSWELPLLESLGLEVGSHTASHPCLDRCTAGMVRSEIIGAHEALIQALGRPPRAFAYPNGNLDIHAERQLNHLGYQAAFLYNHRFESAPPRDMLRISRLRVDSRLSVDSLALVSSGLQPLLRGIVSSRGREKGLREVASNLDPRRV